MTKIYTTGWPLAKRLEYYSEPHESGCVLWTSSKIPNGYGTISIDGKADYVHRAAWKLKSGQEIPKGMDICHTCDVRNCINSEHLFLGTRQDNVDDMIKKGRQGKPNAKLSYEKVFEMRWLEAMGRSTKSLAEEYGVAESVASRAITGKTWQFENHD